jgi:uncharacterized protein
MRSVFLILIRGYQWLLRPFLGAGATCRFYPTCSCYAHEAITRYGAWRGLCLTVARLSRCHPWHEGGYDPVVSEHDCTATRSTHLTS